MSWNYGGCFFTNCIEGCCDYMGYCPSHLGNPCYRYYSRLSLSQSAKIGIGIGAGFFAIIIIIAIVICIRRRRALLNPTIATHTVTMVNPAGPAFPAQPFPQNNNFGNNMMGMQGNFGGPGMPPAAPPPYQNYQNNTWQSSDNNLMIGGQVANGYNNTMAKNF